MSLLPCNWHETMKAGISFALRCTGAITELLSKYVVELEEQSHRPGPEQKPLSFWHYSHAAVFRILTPTAEDLITISGLC